MYEERKDAHLGLAGEGLQLEWNGRRLLDLDLQSEVIVSNGKGLVY